MLIRESTFHLLAYLFSSSFSEVLVVDLDKRFFFKQAICKKEEAFPVVSFVSLLKQYLNV